MQAVARLVFQGLGAEVRIQPVPGRRGVHHRAEGQGVVRRRQGIGIAEVDLVLAGTLLMVGTLRPDAHALQGKAHLPADILPLVGRGNIHIPGIIVGDPGGLAVLVPAEEVKFHLRAEGEGQSRRLGILHRFFQ